MQAKNAEQAMAIVEENRVELAMVDLRMPGEMDGLELMRWLRQRIPPIDVVILTAYATLDSSLSALREGAYDYLVKPVSTAQVLETAHRCMQRRQSEQQRQRVIIEIEQLLGQLKQAPAESENHQTSILSMPSLIIDLQKRLVVRKGQPVNLTPTEFELLAYLASHSDRVVSCKELVEAAQGYQTTEVEARPIVRVNIRRLRKKIEEDPDRPRYIQTVRDRGYRFVPA
jgi:two-component system alkaline phosphatase synthesis response regulator PhoP